MTEYIVQSTDPNKLVGQIVKVYDEKTGKPVKGIITEVEYKTIVKSIKVAINEDWDMWHFLVPEDVDVRHNKRLELDKNWRTRY